MQPDSKTHVDHRKRTFYFPRGMFDEIESEARRQGRSRSWIVQKAWYVARDRIRAIQAPPV